MTKHGNKRPNLFPPRTMFHDGNSDAGHVVLSSQTDRSSDELPRSPPAHLAHRAASERSRPASVHLTGRTHSIMEHHFLSPRRQRSLSTDKPLPPMPTEHQEHGSREPKAALTSRRSNLGMGIGRDRSKSPGKPSPKFHISSPFDPKKGVPSSTNPFDTSDQSWTLMSRKDKIRGKHGLLEDPDPHVTALPVKSSADRKPTIPRSSSAFSFGSSLIYVGSSLGSVFKFGSFLKKGSTGKAKRPANNTAFQEALLVKDSSSSQRLLDASDANTTLRKAHSSDETRGTISDHQVRETIEGSPQLQKFFFGTKLYDESKSGKNAPFYRRANSADSPTKTRRSMYDLGRGADEVVSSGKCREVLRDLDIGHRGLGIAAQEYSTARPSHEPAYQFADRVKPRLITIPPRTPSRLATAHDGSGQSQMLRKPLDLNVTGSNTAPTKFDENISGLCQHPNVNEFAVAPAWYKEEKQKAKQLDDANKMNLTQRLLARDESRRHEILIPDEYHLWGDSRSVNNNPIPSINVTRVASPSKRSSTDAELTEESPMKMRKNTDEGFNEEMLAGLELMTALDEIHGCQQEQAKSSQGSTDLAISRGRRPNRDSIDGLVSEAEDMNLAELEVPPRHPARLFRHGRFRRLSMPLSMDNKSETHTPHVNFSTPWPARGRRGGYQTFGEVPTPRPPHNTPVLLPTPQFPRDHLRIIGQEHEEDSDDDLGQKDEKHRGFGVAE